MNRPATSLELKPRILYEVAKAAWDGALAERREDICRLVCEEFGYPRDSFKFATSMPASARDSYYKNLFEQVVKNRKEGGKFAGCNFWGWGGFGVARHTYWELGDDYLGDPAQEQQGLNTVFVTDSSTVHCIEKYTSLLK